MIIKKITAAIAAGLCLLCAVSCGKDEDKKDNLNENEKVTGIENVTKTMTDSGELITPAEGSDEADLGSYYLDDTGIKLYFSDDSIPTGAMQALKNYFLSFQNRDYDAYRNSLFPDYVSRYDTYLRENYDYDLENSFKIQCDYLRDMMRFRLTGTYDEENNSSYSGDFTITRLRLEPPILKENETEEQLIKDFFADLDQSFDMDYYGYVSENSDGFEYLSFFIIAEGEDNEEHLLLSEMEMIFVVKDGNYYTLG